MSKSKGPQRVGIMRVVTSEDHAFLKHHQRMIQAEHPALTFETRCLPDQPNGIHDAATLSHAQSQIETLASDWGHQLNGLIVSCAADPGLKKLKEILSVPVVGAGEACCEIALTHGSRIGVIGIGADAPPVFHAWLDDRLICYRQPNGVTCTHDIHTEEGKIAIIAAIQELKAENVDAVALACTGMATTDVAALVALYTNMPVINPVLATGEIMARCLAVH
ncbi:aspartate/glutamate racemase family protein [Halomonas piscis]|uniref:aspartate/glutamate racemase family protein n=1 Tax=Halomonas piscis TaxID=3031727 RepID=UPI0028A1C5D3|nr:aspartate/glutamate racemase family protein [Halomonas piscis]